MATVITAGTISATTAAGIHADKDKFAQKIENADYYIPENGDWFSNVYLTKRTDIPNYVVMYYVLFMKRYTAYPDMLRINVGQDADIDKIENLIEEYLPDAAVEISQPSEADRSRSIQISGYPYNNNYTFEETIGMEITIEQARIFYDALRTLLLFRDDCLDLSKILYNETALCEAPFFHQVDVGLVLYICVLFKQCSDCSSYNGKVAYI